MASSKTNVTVSSASRRIRWVAVVTVVSLLLGAFVIFFPNTSVLEKRLYLYIRTGATYNDVLESLENKGVLYSLSTFKLVARLSGYPTRIKPGRYELESAMSNLELVRLLRSGRQSPVKLVIPKIRTKEAFVALLSSELEASGDSLTALLSDSLYLQKRGLTPSTALAAVFPDTYEFYWNTGACKAFEKIAKSYENFWTADRKAAAQKQGLTPVQASILASIVEEETQYIPEKPTIASVYLNRYRKGMKLQADPTARYAGGDFTIKRVTSQQTSLPSPYNTYYVTGLPIGPICTPSKSSLNAVLAAPQTDYLFFCAKEDFSGSHNFAATYAEHLVNARKFQQALNERNIH